MRRSPAPARHRKSRALPLGFYTQELPCHRVDLGEICRDLLIAAALTGDRMEAAVRERLGRACAAKMDCRGKLPLLLRAGRRLSRARENRRDFLVQKYCRKLDCTARWDPRIEPDQRAAVLEDDMIADAIVSRLGEGCVGHLKHADAARGRLVDREGVPGQPPPPIGARDRIAGGLDLRQRGEQLG